MPAEHLTLSTRPPAAAAEADYDAICAAVMATARGRWFLDEYTKRNRNCDTLEVLAAIARVEASVVGDRAQQASQQAHQEVRIELLEMARTIAQTRAEVAGCRPAPSQQPAAEGAMAAPDIAAAAERLRQIAWTMRACGIEVVASDQIGQIAETILSADALRSLGEQRAQKLTEALHDLEHRIDRMLDAHVAAANGSKNAEPAAASALPQLNAEDRDATPVTLAMAMIAAALRGDAAATAETGPAPSPATAEAAAPAQDAAPPASGATEYPMDDDVVLTVADSAVEPAPDPTVASVREPVPPTEVDAQDLKVERVELELKLLLPALKSAAEEKAETDFVEIEVAPLVVATAAERRAELHPAVIEEAPDEPAGVPASAVDDVAEGPHAQAPAVAMASAEPEAPSDRVPAYAGTSGTQVEPSQLRIVATATEAEPADAPPPAAAAADPIAIQVDHDLDVLTDFVPDDIVPGDAREPAEPARAHATRAGVPVADLVADAQASRAQLSDTLAAIESELFGSTRPDARANPSAAKAAVAPAVHGPLAALMAMSDDERIALFS